MVPRQTCLVVDDESSIRRLVKSILESHSHEYKVLEALNGVQGLHLAERLGDTLDVIVNMPGGDGLMFAWSVRQSLPATTIVLISGNVEFEQKQNPKSVFEFVQKPFTSSALLDAIEKATKATRSRAAKSGSNTLPLG